MSVRAYRINKIEREETPTFNLWHDQEFMDFIDDASDRDIMHALNEDGGGQIEISVEALEKAIAEFDFGTTGEGNKEQIQADIDFAKKVGDDYLLYDCF